MAEIEILPQKIVDMRTIILKSRFDSKRVKLQGDALKTSFFVRFGFLKPKPEEILLVAFSKYYEPYMVIGGKYSIDYCKRHNYALKIEDKAQAIFINGKQLKPEPFSMEDDAKVIKLVGEEHPHYENESYVILDRMMQEISPENLFFAPFESDFENQPVVDFDLRKPQISLEDEISVVRSKVAKRPSDIAEIIREKFEINERTIIYSPVYELTYKNIKNGKTVTALINSITGRIIIGKFDAKSSKKLCDPLETSANLPVVQTRFFRVEPEQAQTREDAYLSIPPNGNSNENLVVEEKVNAIAADSRQPRSAFQFNAENMKHVATDFVTRLGYKQGQFPTMMYLDGETDVVELRLQEELHECRLTRRQGKLKGTKLKKQRWKRASSRQKER